MVTDVVGDDGDEAIVTVDSVQERFREMYSDLAVRRRCAELLADVIESAAKRGSSRWVVTLTREPFITVTVGRAYVLRLLVERVQLPVINGALTDQDRRSLSSRADVIDQEFTVIDDVLTYDLEAKNVDVTPLLRSASEAFIDAAAETARQPSNARKHRPAIIEYLEQELGRTLPQPEYVATEPRRTSATATVTREQILAGMTTFDADLRSQPDWQGWEDDGNHKFAIVHEGRRYPPKMILSLASGADRRLFSGGEATNRIVADRGFEVTELTHTAEPLRGLTAALGTILKGYSAARKSGPLRKDHPVVAAFRQAEAALRRSRPVATRPTIEVEFSVGKGNWAAVPWIALLDTRETSTTQDGRYVVLLFKEDCSGVYLTLNQGVTAPTRDFGRAVGLQKVRERAAEIRSVVSSLTNDGFALDDNIALQKDAGLGKAYEASTVAHKLYVAGAIPSDEQLESDLEAVLSAYDDVLDPQVGNRAWIFQGNPEIFDVGAAVRSVSQMPWLVSRHGDSMRVGDRVYLWESGKHAGIVATAEIVDDVKERPEDPKAFPFWRKPVDSTPKPRVIIEIDDIVEPRLPKQTLLDDPRFADLGFLRGPMGTNFPLTEAHQRALDELLSPTSVAPGDLCVAFANAVRNAGLTFGTEHDTIVRCFFASVLTKPFVILTGLSGSGKTQLALKLGEWIGESRYRVIPVRPDWTGPESLLGYEDALLPNSDGRRAWHAPDALQLMLRAARDPNRPYLIVLDEMNLAHVERYFADVLSGVESREAVLPNLEQGADGLWRVIANKPARIPLPRNLIIIGTVNVDETTYMFSPKVLDRANTIEFRVPTSALPTDVKKLTRPGRCKPAGEPELGSLTRIMSDDGWHTANAHSAIGEFAELVRHAHEGLAQHGFEFGHRTYYEALRLASVLAACEIDDTNDALDIFLLQKVLPRLHGSRRKLEPVLRMLAAFAFERTAPTKTAPQFDPLQERPGKTAVMPRTFSKLVRMTRALYANQFASFSD